MTLRHDYKKQNSSSAFKMAGEPLDQDWIQDYKEKKELLQLCRERVEKKGLAGVHGDTLEKREIYVDQLLHPSEAKDLKKIKFFRRVSFVLNCM